MFELSVLLSERAYILDAPYELARRVSSTLKWFNAHSGPLLEDRKKMQSLASDFLSLHEEHGFRSDETFRDVHTSCKEFLEKEIIEHAKNKTIAFPMQRLLWARQSHVDLRMVQ